MSSLHRAIQGVLYIVEGAGVDQPLGRGLQRLVIQRLSRFQTGSGLEIRLE